jgi:hypothetical protein
MCQSSNIGNDSNKYILIQEEVKTRVYSDKACYHLVQKLLSSRLLSRNLKD